MIATVSGIVFILITAMFGVTVNRYSGDVTFTMSPGDDWSKPQLNKPIEDENNINPMRQYPDWIYLSMILGYFITIGILCHGWFQYMQYREKIRMEILLRRKKN